METTYKSEVEWIKLMVIKDGGRPAFNRYRITSSKDICGLQRQIAGYFDCLDREEFVIIGLDGNNRTIFFHSVSVGCLTSSIVHPREVFKMAIVGNAASLILCHNHTSGDPTPSLKDIDITKRLTAAGELLGIKIMDHVIFGDDTYLSFVDKGLL